MLWVWIFSLDPIFPENSRRECRLNFFVATRQVRHLETFDDFVALEKKESKVGQQICVKVIRLQKLSRFVYVVIFTLVVLPSFYKYSKVKAGQKQLSLYTFTLLSSFQDQHVKVEFDTFAFFCSISFHVSVIVIWNSRMPLHAILMLLLHCARESWHFFRKKHATFKG